MSGFLSQLSSFFSPSKSLETSIQPATLNKTKPVNTANPLSPVAKNKVVGPLNFSQQGGKRKSLKRNNKKTYKAKRR